MSIEKAYKMYVFDLDGTLVDTRTDIARGLEMALSGTGYDVPSREHVVSFIGGGSENAVRKLTGQTCGDLTPILSAFMSAYDNVCSDNTALYEGGRELLHRLKAQGAVLVLVTMKSRVPTYKILRKHHMDIFHEIITFDDVEKHKPDPESFVRLLKKYGIEPCDALMIGDTVTDMRYAKAAGADACAMLYGYGVTDEVLAEAPRYTLCSFLDF